MHNLKSFRKKCLFFSHAWEFHTWVLFGVLGRGAGGGDKGTLVQAERRGYRPPEKPAGLPLYQAPSYWLSVKKSLEEGEKATTHCSFVPKGQMATEWIRGWGVNLPLSNSSDFHFPINSIQLHPRTVELPFCPSHVNLSAGHMCMLSIHHAQLASSYHFLYLLINSVKEERLLLPICPGESAKRESGAIDELPFT